MLILKCISVLRLSNSPKDVSYLNTFNAFTFVVEGGDGEAVNIALKNLWMCGTTPALSEELDHKSVAVHLDQYHKQLALGKIKAPFSFVSRMFMVDLITSQNVCNQVY